MERDKRIGGLLLLIAAAAMPFIIAEYLAITRDFPGADASASVLEGYYDARYADLARGWHFEVLSMAMLGAGALIRMGQSARSGWAITAIGVALVLPMYPSMIGGYGTIFGSSNVDLASYHLVRTFATEIFYVGNLVISAGLGVALWQERDLRLTRMPGWSLLIGILANAIGAVGFGVLHFGGNIPLSVIGPAGLVGFIVLAVFGAYLTFGKAPE